VTCSFWKRPHTCSARPFNPGRTKYMFISSQAAQCGFSSHRPSTLRASGWLRTRISERVPA
jgi:hypothetical protein